MKVFLILITAVAPVFSAPLTLSDSRALEIGRRIWKNECGGSVGGLTSWNAGEEFPSLGIAHFIWYPAGRRGVFEESFPGLVHFLKSSGKPVDDWMLGSCPWATRAEFLAEVNDRRLSDLRKLLADTVAFQARYAAMRLERALSKMLSAAPPGNRTRIRENFQRVAAEPLGFYALVDYVNFKGEGVNPSERYGGQGWGLLQVLETMRDDGPVLPAFAAAAGAVLTRRVKNSPPGRNESQWLPGWRNRIKTYTE